MSGKLNLLSSSDATGTGTGTMVPLHNMTANESYLRKRVYKFYSENIDKKNRLQFVMDYRRNVDRDLGEKQFLRVYDSNS
uniref:Uncharacterized protein n=1 Tax=Romanomermis culicivorax TaxID=13658 RepID=A0A915IF74_ROMCU